MSDTGEALDMTNEVSDNRSLNMQKLNDTFMNNEVIIKKILSAFKNSFGDFEGQFREAESTEDTEVMSRLAHSLKGSAGNIRAESLSEKAEKLQLKIDGGDQIADEFDDLLNSLDSLNKEIDALLA